MAIKQVSIFLENKQGTLVKITQAFADLKINLRAMSLADSTDFGIARIIVDNPEEIVLKLQEKDYIAKINDVIAIEIPDETGSLNSILKLLAENDRNVEYMYGFTGKKTNSAYMIIRTTDVEKAEEVLAKGGIKVLTQKELSEI
ncbi:MAG: ACT domain-containing protein [Treponema sp.]|uniref:ACT domain-containing protein n=1 Tax=Treponema sp. TaxID=166 RepID=UPI001B7BAB20|nr:ACT domain-containing protein [Treponema sp.]MBP5401935.1 ACT domain-containing protein [Treponema sp.]MBR5932488.1 ACT domain-containing protein [Treponema sp.]